MDKLIVEFILRDMGANGCLKGFWLTIHAVLFCMEGKTPGESIRCAAAEMGILPPLARSRIGNMIGYMEKSKTEEYAAVCIGGRKPTPNELIGLLAQRIKERKK